MAFAENELQKINKLVGDLCKKKAPDHLGNEYRVDYHVKNHDVIISETTPCWDDPNEFTELPLAKIKFVRSEKIWKLYWMRADLKWYAYKPVESSKDLAELVKEIDEDPNGCFWG